MSDVAVAALSALLARVSLPPICSIDRKRYSMRAPDFSTRYNRSQPEPANELELAQEGFSLYTPTGMVWSLELSTDDINRFFPKGQFMGKWGAVVSVGPTDCLTIPHPEGGEVYVINKELFKKTYALHNARDHIPSEAESLTHWETVMRQEARVCRKRMKVFAKIAQEDGVLGEVGRRKQRDVESAIAARQQEEEEEVNIEDVPMNNDDDDGLDTANEEADDVAMVSRKAGAPSPKANVSADFDHREVTVDVISNLSFCREAATPDKPPIARLARELLANTTEPKTIELAEQILALANRFDEHGSGARQAQHWGMCLLGEMGRHGKPDQTLDPLSAVVAKNGSVH